ncbi:hypothetical protein N219_12555 (plasmid) [Limosilactobacillus fermentum MTCC 8711]|nr:hypothetical protein N219_12555 [Limosilactobacillus fermentum MTCC 8711]
MQKSTTTLIWTLTAIVLIAFSNFFIHKGNIAPVINIIGCLILVKEFIQIFEKGSKKVIFWGYIGVAACLAAVFIDLILLAF